jgi:hypothetical protein
VIMSYMVAWTSSAASGGGGCGSEVDYVM